MQSGDNRAARAWAEKAAALVPGSEEPWLFLAALSGPHASIKYLKLALKINPRSQRARKGMHWAAHRLRVQQANQLPKMQTSPSRVVTTEVGKITQPVAANYSTSRSKTQSVVRKIPAKALARSVPVAESTLPGLLSNFRWLFLAIFLLAICITAAWAIWPGSASPFQVFLHAPRSSPALPSVLLDLFRPTYTPSSTATTTPSATYTSSPTLSPTSSPTLTLTPSPTLTPTQTLTLSPTYTDTPSPTETLIPSDTPLPTKTEIPWPTDTPEPVVDGGGGARWIDVNLSEQRLYAFEGDTLVASFLVSTGLSPFTTVTGQYYIYIKLTSTDMAGDGYYLPDVPYTMYFYKGYGIHGTYWHNNFGSPMSHGCVNMYTPDAEWLFYWASVGTLVNVHY